MAVAKRSFVDFRCHAPVISAATGAAAAETDDTRNYVTAGGVTFELHNDGANDQIVPGRIVDANSLNGWELPLEEGTVADNDGLELTQGVLADANARHVFTIGTDPAFVLRVKIGIPVVADYDVLCVGFRGAASYVANVDTPAAMLAAYADKYAINVEDGDYHVQASLNGSDTETDVDETTAQNDDTPLLEVRVSAAGVATAYLDGTLIDDAAAHTFDDGDTVVPFLRLARSGTGADTRPILQTWFCGLQ